MLQRRMQHIAIALVFLAVGVKEQAFAATDCKTSKGDLLVYIGTYGYLKGNGFSPIPASSIDQPGQTFDKTHGIYAACLNQKTGSLAMIGLVAPVNRVSWLLADPVRPVLYATGLPADDLTVDGNIFSFAVDKTSGKLQPLGQIDSGGLDPTHLSVDERSHTLFVANHGNGKVTALPIKTDGGLEAVVSSQTEAGKGPSPRQAGPFPHGVLVDPTRRYLLSADFGADRLFVYHFDAATKALSPAEPAFEPLPAGAGPRHLAFSPNGRFLYLCTELSAEIRSYRWNSATGHLKAAQTMALYPPDYTGAKSAADLVFSRDGRFLYQSLRGDQNSIVVFKVNQQTGALSELQRISAQGTAPWNFAIDPTGHWLLVANVVSNSVAVLKIDPAAGTLTATGQALSMLQPDAITFNLSH